MTEEIDDSLYSRQRCVLGDVAMRKLSRSKVFLCGLDAVGVEIAKNLVLGGIEELTIQDNAICTVADMGVQFFIRQADVDSGKTRAEASLPHLVALNPYVRVSMETNDVTSVTAPLASEANLQLLKPLWNPGEEKTTKVECLIVTQCSLHAATLLNIFCRKHSIRFIYTNVYGVLGNLFCDFGPQFNVLDPDGEPPKEFFIGHVGKSANLLTGWSLVRTRPLPLDFPCLGLGNLAVSQPSCFPRVTWQLGTERVLQLDNFFTGRMGKEADYDRDEDEAKQGNVTQRVYAAISSNRSVIGVVDNTMMVVIVRSWTTAAAAAAQQQQHEGHAQRESDTLSSSVTWCVEDNGQEMKIDGWWNRGNEKVFFSKFWDHHA
ncbi:Ubiquitin-like modifier-activating enzyme 6 [Clonorchis sinensis]|uniref:Ubiquitin-like modifier-activating enzyme 6 n=1 Tax=Clonorchis sinensis TaxID=79923 RepID=A0A8T1MXB3_CLOSI|nr:Ubiquitin-like modifier-activating enzyme 6 [Clonorchis sinensis]